MDNMNILRIAMEQSAIDANCEWEDFTLFKNVIVPSKANPKARRYLALPHVCCLISYGNNIVASVDERYRDIVSKYINAFPVEHCFETPNMHVLNDAFQEFGYRVCFLSEYFLPDLNLLRELPCQYPTKVLTQSDFSELYIKEWSNALCEQRKELDVLGVGAYDNGKLIGLAGCSADCETMWQIGVDVLPEYRRQGIASALTSRLAIDALRRGKVPFYCCAWSNVKSARNAIRSGFRPAWVELNVKDAKSVDELNAENCKVLSVSLTVDEANLRNRLSADIAKGNRSADVVDRSLERIELYQTLDTIKEDTSDKTVREIADEIRTLSDRKQEKKNDEH